MERAITGFHRDDEGHWVAELRCGHGQHTRHDPPLVERPWVLSEDGRRSRLGVLLHCKRCDDLEIPEGFRAYRRTPTFDEKTLPAALRSKHTTKVAVWGMIHVMSGQLRYRIFTEPLREEILTPEKPGIVPAEIEHDVTPLGSVRFFVEFFGPPA